MHQSPALTLSVGVTGHRLNKLDPADRVRLRQEVDRILAALKRALEEVGREASDPPGISRGLLVVSPLAEGADRIVAEVALARGAQLIAPLPFGRDTYALDFPDPESRKAYSAFLEKAAEIVELDGRHDDQASRNDAYARVGALVVERSDVLIALWDGEKAAGLGGTAEVVALAKESGVPVLWLPTAGASPAGEPKAPRLILADDTICADALEALVAITKSNLQRQL